MKRPNCTNHLCLAIGLASLLCNCSEGERTVSRSTGTKSTTHSEQVAGNPNNGEAGNALASGGNAVSPSSTASQGGAGHQTGTMVAPVVNPCTAEEAATLSTLTAFAADDPKFQYIGRVDSTDPKRPTYAAAGVVVRAKFRGASLAVKLQDQFKDGKRNYYDVLIDDQIVPIMAMPTAQNTYPIAPPMPLACGDHTVKIVKRTEAGVGAATFLGLTVSTLLEPDPLPNRRLEVIGDSITCGTGAEPIPNPAIVGLPTIPSGDYCNTDGWGQPTNNARHSWGWYLGEMLDAQVVNTCVSGIGLVRNYEVDEPAIPMPTAYVKTFPVSRRTADWETSPNWISPTNVPPPKYLPDVIVIALGTNDFAPGKTGAPDYRPSMVPQAFADAYIAFIAQLREYYKPAPNLHIYYTDSQLLGDNWPRSGIDKSKTDFEAALVLLDAYYAVHPELLVKKALGGYTKVLAKTGLGCSGHTKPPEQHAAAENMKPVIAADMGW